MDEINQALTYGLSLLHTKYIWWKNEDTNPDYIFYFNTFPSITDIRNKGVNCAGFINLVRQSIGRTMIEPCLLYTSPSPRDLSTSRMPSSA